MKKETREGIKNFSQIESTVVCAGAINLREAQEPGVNVERDRAAAEAAGLRYFHIPFNGAKPDPKVAGAFVKVISSGKSRRPSPKPRRLV